MELVIDIGNTRVKAGLFINNGLHKVLYPDTPTHHLQDAIGDQKIQKVIISSVKKDVQQVRNYWEDHCPTWVLSKDTKLPIEIDYDTPETLGNDRIAGVVGGRFLFNSGPVLSIDIGTCITFDILTAENHYLGGSISPGIDLRYKSMNAFTSSLPLVEIRSMDSFIGNSTETSISTGVINGIAREIDGVIGQYEIQFEGLKTVICGGDARYFVNHLKKKIFANQNLVLLGLHKILLFND